MKYQTKFPTCRNCGRMFTAISLGESQCPLCRPSSPINFGNLILLLLFIAFIAAIIGYASSAPASETASLGWQRCYHHGDWRETPYCAAVAQDEAEQ